MGRLAMPSAEDAILSRAGLEPIAGELSYPMLIMDGDECWFTAVRNGVRVRVCKIPVGELFLMVRDGAHIAYALGKR